MHLPNPSTWVGWDMRLIFKQSLTGLNSVYLLDWLPKAKELSLPYYLPIAGGRIIVDSYLSQRY